MGKQMTTGEWVKELEWHFQNLLDAEGGKGWTVLVTRKPRGKGKVVKLFASRRAKRGVRS